MRRPVQLFLVFFILFNFFIQAMGVAQAEESPSGNLTRAGETEVQVSGRKYRVRSLVDMASGENIIQFYDQKKTKSWVPMMIQEGRFPAFVIDNAIHIKSPSGKVYVVYLDNDRQGIGLLNPSESDESDRHEGDFQKLTYRCPDRCRNQDSKEFKKLYVLPYREGIYLLAVDKFANLVELVLEDGDPKLRSKYYIEIFGTLNSIAYTQGRGVLRFSLGDNQNEFRRILTGETLHAYQTDQLDYIDLGPIFNTQELSHILEKALAALDTITLNCLGSLRG